MRRRASSPSESKRHAGCTFILGRLDRHPVARGAGGLSFRLEGAPPSEEFPFIQESELWRSYFCRKGGLILEWAGHRRLSLSADQVLFLPVRTEAYRGQFASESFYGTLVRMEAKAAWSALRAMHSDLGESISRAWNDPCMLKAALWSEALFSALDYMQPGHIMEITMSSRRWRFCSCSMHSERGWPYLQACDYHTHSQIETIREIQKILGGAPGERLTIQMLSQQFRISGTALKSCFRQVYGVPIHQYLLEQRMAQAAELLTTTTQSVLQISTAVGYSSVSQFGIAFKQRYHMSPSQFRRNANKNPFATVFVRNG